MTIAWIVTDLPEPVVPAIRQCGILAIFAKVAISLYLKEDYRRGGLRVLPLARGEEALRRASEAGVLKVLLEAS